MFLNRKEKKKMFILFAMMIVAAIFETLGIGLIVPIVAIITNPNIISEQPLLAFIYNSMNLSSYTIFIIVSVIFLLFVFILKNLYLLFFNYMQFKIILNLQVKISRELFNKYLTKPYVFHLQRNTADLLRNVNDEVPKVSQGILLSGFQLATEILVTIFILILLLTTAPLATLAVIVILGGSVALFFMIFRKKISKLGVELQKVNGRIIKWVNQGLGASKEIKVQGKESFFINAYTEQSQLKANNGRYYKMLEQAPRLFIESLLVSTVLVTMLIIILRGTDTEQLISTMALFAMSAFRLMPSINRVMGLITTIKYSKPALKVVYNDLYTESDLEINQLNSSSESEVTRKAFLQSIELENVSFSYPNQERSTISDVSLTIPIGSSVAFIGESGAGKSTIVDVILGLLTPQKGRILVDKKNLNDQKSIWQQRIGYIPQSIFLIDDTIRGNVAFGIEKDRIDDENVWRALEQAQLKDFVIELPDQLETSVGERGVRLSGGQRQRIGIARALYHNPEILFMDEATSALDNETETEIMKSIDNLRGEKTLIIIAHRLSTIKNCDKVFHIQDGHLVATEKNNNEKDAIVRQIVN
ncbi:ABC transporter ATP-binding protein [Bacillus sp. YZJH907-2]|uniref:ABC transporter ATP-binding protein n=2 Tax=Halalkalibacter suaedae TaxID=2822140 RepID=A0A941ATE1_9BACI|nr:ABC transporter ATP-binding protein [Bacillus suaedae]MBP3951509.1 ABC transporter ATP-binding protein [Bacillus suaedae]